MKSVRTEAIKLRKQGKSYSEITKELGVAKSTLSGWLKDIHLTKAAQQRLKTKVRQGLYNGLVKRNKLQTKLAQDRSKLIQNTAAKRIGDLSRRELMLVCVALYWGEGYKKLAVKNGRELVAHEISFVNSDPEMIQMFINFLKTVLGVIDDEIHLGMRLYNHINEKNAQKFWMNVTKLQKSNFKQTTWLVSGASKRKRPQDFLQFGTLQVAVYRTEKFHELMGLIKGLKKSP